VDPTGARTGEPQSVVIADGVRGAQRPMRLLGLP
jgi:hypothetical protein